jgi:Tfp pilus assembly PilM family ATPase
MRRTRYSPIGVDVSTRSIRAVQLARRGDRAPWRLHAATAVPREAASAQPGWTPPSQGEHERLAGVLGRQGFEGSDLVLAVPADRMVESVVELPPRSSGAPLANLAAAELGRVHKVDAASLEVAFWEIPTPARTTGVTEYMVAGCPRQAGLDLIDPFEDAGLTVRALDVRALALQRACAPALAGAGAIDAILCLGWNHTTLMFVVDGVMSFQRTLDGVDGRSLATGVAQKLRISPASVVDLVLRQTACSLSSGTPARREIEREIAGNITAYAEDVATQFGVSCAYISRRYPTRSLAGAVITGEYGALPGVPERLEGAGVKARRLDLGEAVDAGESAGRLVLGTEYIASLGLALHPLREAA